MMDDAIAACIKGLPDLPGVYFFYNAQDDLVYIGKSIHIRKRVLQHFQGKDRKSLKIQASVKRIAFELMGNELMALLHESDLIKQHQPLFNRSQRRSLFQYGLYVELDEQGCKVLKIGAIKDNTDEITSFGSMHEAKQTLFYITEKYELCQKINGLYKTRSSCFQYQIKRCKGICIGKEAPESYNLRVDAFLQEYRFERFTELFELSGRHAKEKGLVYIEHGVYKGFGFCGMRTDKKNYLKYINYKADNKDVRRILMRHLIRQKIK